MTFVGAKTNYRRRLVLGLALGAVPGCDDVQDPSSADQLPVGWEVAEPVGEFIQFACSGNPYEGSNEHAVIRGGEREVLVEYREAHFRCAQEVEGFYDADSEGVLKVLVQPVVMSPEGVAACDCLYDIFLLIDGLEEEEYKVSVYRRWDEWNDPNDPVLIDEAVVSATAD